MMMQFLITYYLVYSLIFLFFGLFTMSWLIIHIEHGRHFSKQKVALAIIIGSIRLGFGIHFALLAVPL